MNQIKTIKYTVKINDESRVSLSIGNEKIGKMINFSTLPGNKDNMLKAKEMLLTDVPGTCCGNCSACFKNCYAAKSAKLHHNAIIPSWGKNTLMLRSNPVQVFDQIDQQIRKLNKKFYEGKASEPEYKFYRHNVSGELQSLQELELLNDLANKHPAINFGVYSKNSEVLIEFFKKHGQTADNLTINLSEWHGTMSQTRDALDAIGAKYNIFEYDDSNRSHCTLSEDDKARLAKTIHCPGIDKNGHHVSINGQALTCDKCKLCYKKLGKTIAVYDH